MTITYPNHEITTRVVNTLRVTHKWIKLADLPYFTANKLIGGIEQTTLICDILYQAGLIRRRLNTGEIEYQWI